jgi:hypothetical protein
MLQRKLVIATTAAISCFLIGGAAREIADAVRFYRPDAAWIGGFRVLSLASALVGLVAFLYCSLIKPEAPRGWRARHPWSIERVGPPAAFLAVLVGGAVAAALMPEAPARLAWQLLRDSTLLAFALVVWESRWLWTQYAEANGSG